MGEGTTIGSPYPLRTRSVAPEVRQARSFRNEATTLTGAILAEEFAAEVAAVTERGPAALPERASDDKLKEADRVLRALVERNRDEALVRPEEGRLVLADAAIALEERPSRRSTAPSIPPIPLLGLGETGRPVVIAAALVAAEDRRIRTGDTPLHLLLRSLAQAAFLHAHRATLTEILETRCGLPVDLEQPPEVAVLATPHYWELCRKREAQRGAAWIGQMERLAREISSQVGVPVFYWALEVADAKPSDEKVAAERADGSPPTTLGPAWEESAARLRARPRSKKARASAEDAIIESDLTRPVRSYAMEESYVPGDRIEHPSLGLGVVQAIAGARKVRVLFGEQIRVLVQDSGRRP